ncbi:MAG: hypothetical protein Q4E06_01250 [Lautropia sp.]|nr:hypothetical protein [Lautropia sp.]
MGFQVGTACYETAEAAASAVASSVGGTLQQIGPQLYAVQTLGVGPDRITYAMHGVSQPGTINVTVPFTPQPCGLLTAADGVAVGWQIAGVWVVAWAAMMIVRAMWAAYGSDDDGKP